MQLEHSSGEHEEHGAHGKRGPRIHYTPLGITSHVLYGIGFVLLFVSVDLVFVPGVLLLQSAVVQDLGAGLIVLSIVLILWATKATKGETVYR